MNNSDVGSPQNKMNDANIITNNIKYLMLCS